MKWKMILGGIEHGDHPTGPQLADAVERFWDEAPPEARKYVAELVRRARIGGGGRTGKDSRALVVEVRNAEWICERVQRWAARYRRIRLNTNRHPADIRRNGRPLLLVATDRLDWTKAGGKWKLRKPVDAAWRRERRKCGAAHTLAAVLDDPSSDPDGQTAKRARRQWDEAARSRRQGIKDGLKAGQRAAASLKRDRRNLADGRKYTDKTSPQ